MSLAPRWLSLKRAFAVCMIVTVAWVLLSFSLSCICMACGPDIRINPWYLLGSASIFVTFISSYQIFLFSIVGVCMTDYYIISKGRLNLPHLYVADRQAPYWYNYGLNWRAFLAYAVGAGINFAGFLDNMGVVEFRTSITHSFYFAWIT